MPRFSGQYRTHFYRDKHRQPWWKNIPLFTFCILFLIFWQSLVACRIYLHQHPNVSCLFLRSNSSLQVRLPRSSPSVWWSWRWRAPPPATPSARSRSPCSPWDPEWRWTPSRRLGNPGTGANQILGSAAMSSRWSDLSNSRKLKIPHSYI